QHELERQIPGSNLGATGGRGHRSQIPPGFTKLLSSEHSAIPGEFAVRSRTQPDIVAKGPVIQVMTTSAALARVRRDLVVRKARLEYATGAFREHVRSYIVIGQDRRLCLEDGPMLDGELIVGDMRGTQRERRLHILNGSGNVLSRERVHQIK